MLLAAVLFSLWYHADSFAMLCLIGFFIGMRECKKMSKSMRLGMVAFSAGSMLLAICCASLVSIRQLGETAPGMQGAPYLLVLYLIAIVAATDIAGFFGGKLIGGKKCWPSISPGKTWSGTICAFLGGSAAAHALLTPPAGLSAVSFQWLAFLLALPLLAIAGDALESWVKRLANVKDSGNLLPGHGGLLDRIDGLLLTAPLFAAFFHFPFA